MPAGAYSRAQERNEVMAPLNTRPNSADSSVELRAARRVGKEERERGLAGGGGDVGLQAADAVGEPAEADAPRHAGHHHHREQAGGVAAAEAAVRAERDDVHQRRPMQTQQSSAASESSASNRTADGPPASRGASSWPPAGASRSRSASGTITAMKSSPSDPDRPGASPR